MRIERFQRSQAEAVSNIIRRNLVEVNSRDYSDGVISSLVEYYSPETMVEDSRSRCIYVAIQENAVVGTASLANSGSRQSPNCYALAVFVLPELHGQGVGTQLMAAVELEARELGATRITVPASITANEFYQKLGYRFKDGVKELNDAGIYTLEKELG